MGMVSDSCPESEKYVIGCLILDNKTLDEVGAIIVDDMFSSNSCKTLFTEVRNTIIGGGIVDMVSLPQHLKAIGKLDGIGGMKFVSGCCNQATLSNHLDFHCANIRKSYYTREIMRTAQRLVNEPDDSIVAEIQSLSLQRARDLGGNIVDMSKDMAKYLNDHIEKHAEDDALDIGFPAIDRMLHGVRKGDLLTIAGRPGGGKTALMCKIASNVCEKHTVLVFPTEMTPYQYIDRIVSSRSGVDSWRFRKKIFEFDHYSMINKSCEAMNGKSHIVVVGNSQPSIADIQRAVIRIRPTVVIMDYLQRAKKPSAESVTRSVDAFMYGFKTMCVDSGVVGILGCQMNRSIDKSNSTPRLSDLRDSGSIESESDQVLLLHCPDRNADEHSESVDINAYLEKNRHGALGVSQLSLIKKTVSMIEKPMGVV